jgi:hypothetical protein
MRGEGDDWRATDGETGDDAVERNVTSRTLLKNEGLRHPRQVFPRLE